MKLRNVCGLILAVVAILTLANCRTHETKVVKKYFPAEATPSDTDEEDGVASGGGSFGDESSNYILGVAKDDLALAIRNLGHEVIQDLPEGWSAEKIATIVENVKISKNKKVYRFDTELSFNYGEDEKTGEPFIEALSLFYVSHNNVPINNYDYFELKPYVLEARMKLMHEVSHLLAIGIGDTRESDAMAREFANAVLKAFDSASVLCEAPFRVRPESMIVKLRSDLSTDPNCFADVHDGIELEDEVITRLTKPESYLDPEIESPVFLTQAEYRAHHVEGGRRDQLRKQREETGASDWWNTGYAGDDITLRFNRANLLTFGFTDWKFRAPRSFTQYDETSRFLTPKAKRKMPESVIENRLGGLIPVSFKFWNRGAFGERQNDFETKKRMDNNKEAYFQSMGPIEVYVENKVSYFDNVGSSLGYKRAWHLTRVQLDKIETQMTYDPSTTTATVKMSQQAKMICDDKEIDISDETEFDMACKADPFESVSVKDYL